MIWSADFVTIEALLSSYRSLLLAYVRRRVRTDEDAEDIVQITLARAAANMHAFKGQCTFSGWLYRIAANQIITYYQRVLPKTDRQVSLDTGFDGEEPNLQPSAPERSPEELAATADYADRLLKAMREACSEPEYRVIVMMSQGDSAEEVGEMLGMKRPTVKSHHLRGKRKLLAHLFTNYVDLLGGQERISEALALAELEPGEQQAFLCGDWRSDACRDACVKIARCLRLDVAIGLLLLEVIGWTLRTG